jgi:hypothetical protein
MSDPPRDHRRFDDLNWLGRAVYLGGTALRLSAQLIDRAADRAERIAADARREFERELDPNIEDAKVLEERPRASTAERHNGKNADGEPTDEA